MGARRHGGFIPWDDDIDICMSRKDFERFSKLFSRYYPDKYCLQTPEDTHNYPLLLSRVRKKGTCVRTRDDFMFSDFDCGAFVDIFIVENVPDNPILRTLHGVGCIGLAGVLSCRKFFRDRHHLMMLSRGNP